jgi:hypothetical protein
VQTSELPPNSIGTAAQQSGAFPLVNLSGTMSAVKERPKVARRATIPEPAKQAEVVNRKAPGAFSDSFEQETDSTRGEVSAQARSAQLQAAQRQTAQVEITPLESEPAPPPQVKASPLPKFAGTMPEVKQRPKVARHSTLGMPASPSTKKPQTKESTEGAASALPEPKVSKIANASIVTAASGAAKIFSMPEWAAWFPLATGILLGFLSPQLFAIASGWQPWGLRLVFPVVQILGLRETGMSSELTRMLPQLMLFLQFPLEGLLVASNLRRGMRITAALLPVPALHFFCALVLWIVALGSSRPI